MRQPSTRNLTQTKHILTGTTLPHPRSGRRKSFWITSTDEDWITGEFLRYCSDPKWVSVTLYLVGKPPRYKPGR